MHLTDERWRELLRVRATDPAAIERAYAKRLPADGDVAAAVDAAARMMKAPR